MRHGDDAVAEATTTAMAAVAAQQARGGLRAGTRPLSLDECSGGGGGGHEPHQWGGVALGLCARVSAARLFCCTASMRRAARVSGTHGDTNGTPALDEWSTVPVVVVEWQCASQLG